MRAWILVHTTLDDMLKDGYSTWEDESMHSWYTKQGHPTLVPITGGFGYIRPGQRLGMRL